MHVLQKYKVTMAHVVPPIAIGMAKSAVVDKYDLSSIRSIFSGAAPLGKETEIELVQRIKCIVKQGYGMTELSPGSHNTPNHRVVPGSVGILLSNQEAKIVDPTTGKELGIDEEGEL